MSSCGEGAQLPDYGLDELVKDHLRIIIPIPGLKPVRLSSLKKLFQSKASATAINGDVIFRPSDRGFFFEFLGKNELSGRNYRLNVDKLPGQLILSHCTCEAKDGVVEIMLRKRDRECMWSEQLQGVLPTAD